MLRSPRSAWYLRTKKVLLKIGLARLPALAGWQSGGGKPDFERRDNC